MKAAAALALTAGFAVLLLAIYAVHARSFPVQVVFYSAILDAVMAAALTTAAARVLRRRLTLTGFETGLLAAVWLLSGYAFAITGPALLDRSLSFYILEKLDQRGGGIRADAIGRVFTGEYMPEFRLVDVRLTEQVQSGTVEIAGGCVRLTAWGRELAAFSHFVRANLLPRHRLLAGEYTDTLTDPFAHSPQGPQGYECQ